MQLCCFIFLYPTIYYMRLWFYRYTFCIMHKVDKCIVCVQTV